MNKMMRRSKTLSLFHQANLSIWLVAGLFRDVNAWEDDMFYFTSFRNVDEWAKLYKSCDILQPDETGLSSNGIVRTHHLSPIALPKHTEVQNREAYYQAIWNVTKAEMLEANIEVDWEEVTPPLYVFNNPPPLKSAYTVSYGFQKNKECLEDSAYNPCYISPSFGLVRAVVLSAEREHPVDVRANFEIEERERFVAINTGSTESHDKKFYEAVFLGTAEKNVNDGNTSHRSTHTINGKSYPMEIYMFFVDEGLPSMHDATTLVVLVEESEEENQLVKPIVNAVRNHLEEEERVFLRQHLPILQRERTYHHMGENTYSYYDYVKKAPAFETLDEAWKVHQDQVATYDTWEKYEHYMRLIRVDQERLEDAKRDYQEQVVNLDLKHVSLDWQGHSVPPLYQYWLYPVLYKLWGNSSLSEQAKEEEGALMIQRLEHKLKPLPFLKITTTPEQEEEMDQKVYDVFLKYFEDFKRYQRLRRYNDSDPRDTDEDKLNRLLEFQTYDIKPPTWEKLDLTTAYGKLWTVLNEVTGGYLKQIQRVPNFYQDILAYGDSIGIDEVIGIQTEELKKVANRAGYKDEDGKTTDELLQTFLEHIDKNEDEHAENVKMQEDRAGRLNKHKFKRIGSPKGGGMGMTLDQFEQYENMNPLKTHLRNTFQISWLIPNGGGYYTYQGSSPIPPCYGGEETIVFRKPIKMSKDQIRTLSTIPGWKLKGRDITNTLPRIHPLRSSLENATAGIMFEHRRHQFMGEDGVHENAFRLALRMEPFMNNTKKTKTTAAAPPHHRYNNQGPSASLILCFTSAFIFAYMHL